MFRNCNVYCQSYEEYDPCFYKTLGIEIVNKLHDALTTTSKLFCDVIH